MEVKQAMIVIKIDVSMKRYYNIVEEVVYYRIQPISSWSRWVWYYEYLAALVKVKNPTRKVTLYMCNIDYVSREDYIKKKMGDLLRAKMGQLKKLLNERINDDLFGFTSQKHQQKIETVRGAIKALENGEVNFYVPAEYKNTIKNWI